MAYRRATSLAVLVAVVLLAASPSAEAQETVPCKVDAALTCGWVYIPPKYNGKSLFPAGMYELDEFPDSGLCTPECVDIINGPNCAQEKPMLTGACDSLQCSVDVKSACGVTDKGEVTWEQACTSTCQDTMLSNTCEGTAVLYPEFIRYKESFGPFGSECSTWQCMNQLKEHCDYYDDGFQAMPARSMCDVACYAAITSDQCRLANVEVLMPDGTLSDFSQYVDGPDFGPTAPICSDPPPENPLPSVDLIPLNPKAPEPTRPPCEEVSPFGLCWYVDALKDNVWPTPTPTPEEEEAKAPEEETPQEEPTPAPTPALTPSPTEADPANGKIAVNMVVSLGFGSPPAGFPSAPDGRRRQLLQLTIDGPYSVDLPAEWEKEYKDLLAAYASDSASGAVLDPEEDIVVNGATISYTTNGDGTEGPVIVDVDTTVYFEDDSRARWFSATVNSALTEIFAEWGLLFAGVKTDDTDPADQIAGGDSGDKDIVVGLQSIDTVVKDEEDEGGIAMWIIALIGSLVGVALVALLLFLIFRPKKKQQPDAEAAEPPAPPTTDMVEVQPNEVAIPMMAQPASKASRAVASSKTTDMVEVGPPPVSPPRSTIRAAVAADEGPSDRSVTTPEEVALSIENNLLRAESVDLDLLPAPEAESASRDVVAPEDPSPAAQPQVGKAKPAGIGRMGRSSPPETTHYGGAVVWNIDSKK